MKATQMTTYRSLQAQINRLGNRLEDLRTIATSGKKISRPSDDPSVIRPMLDSRAQIRASDRYLKTMGTALDKMQALDGHMEHVENVLVRVKELAINSVNGSLNAQDQITLADQVAAMKAELLDTANARVDGKYIFSGYQEDTRPFSANSAYDPTLYNGADPVTWPVLYQGDGNPTRLEISPGERIQVNLTGNEIFLGQKDTDGDGIFEQVGTDIFGVLTAIEEAMRANNPAGVEARMEALDAGTDQARQLRSQAGNHAQRVETAMGHMEQVRIDLKQMLSRYEDADVIQTYSELTQQETAFEAALNVTSKVSRLSILDFI